MGSAYRLPAAGCIAGALALGIGGCASGERSGTPRVIEPRLLAESDRQWTGVAATPDGRVFVSYPRWGGPYRYAVEEILASGERRAYPSAVMNTWAPGLPPDQRFVCVQSVTVDHRGDLWVLDPANPRFEGVVPGGPKLVRIDPRTDSVAEVILLDERLAPPDSYLNDVRVDRRAGFAYITDSGNGALVVLNLRTGVGRRVLDDHPSTRADPDVVPVIGGREWRFADTGEVPPIHADGIALSRDRTQLYWQALTGRRLSRIDTASLRDFSLSDFELASRIEDLGHTVVTDGMEIDTRGRVFFSALERNAVMMRDEHGELLVLAQDPELDWPDSFAWASDRELLVTTAQIHEGAQFAGASGPDEPYRLWMVRVPFFWPAETE